MKVYWPQDAEQDRDHIWNTIAQNAPVAAARMDTLFSDSAMKLADFPYIGRAGAIPGTRELIPHPSYRLVYEVEQDTVWILALVHTSRQWPPSREGHSIS